MGRISRLRALTPPVQPSNRIPLGLLMVARGKLSHLEVRAALEAQRRAQYGSIGDWIEKLGFASERDITAALALQWGCPVASSFDHSIVDSPGNIPLRILEAFQMVPFNYTASTNTLYLAFGARVDHAAVYAIERISIAALSLAWPLRKAWHDSSSSCGSLRVRAMSNSQRETWGNGANHVELHCPPQP